MAQVKTAPGTEAPLASGIQMDKPTVAVTRPAHPEYGSDVIVDMMRLLGIEYLALTPGASFRGVHDSLVNYNGNQTPSVILCTHEEVAVGVAYGYAKATDRAMAVALHTNVGLLHGSMNILNAYGDRSPIFIVGGTGPLDSTHRRPGVDWNHTNNGQGSVVRDFTKWENQPGSVSSIPEVMLRAWHIAHTEPRGPVYLTLDSTLQEEKIAPTFPMPDVSRYPLSLPPAPPPHAVRTAARWLVAAEHPVLLLGETAQNAQAWAHLRELAELLSASVLQDNKARACFPTNHFLSQASYGKPGRKEFNDVLKEADVVLALDRQTAAGDMRYAAMGHTDHQTLPTAFQNVTPKLITVTLDHYAIKSWSMEFQELPPADLPIAANVEATVALLLEEVRRAVRDDPAAKGRIEARAKALKARRAALEASWEVRRRARWDRTPISIERAVGEMKIAMGADYERTIVSRISNAFPAGIWDFTQPLSYLGRDGAGGLGDSVPIAIGASLALKGSRPIVAFMGDGDTLMAPQALWTAAHYRVPILVFVLNNSSYFNDELHQEHLAAARKRPPENRWVGIRPDDPIVNIAALARSFGVEAFGPVERPEDLAAACAGAAETLRQGRPALIDAHVHE